MVAWQPTTWNRQTEFEVHASNAVTGYKSIAGIGYLGCEKKKSEAFFKAFASEVHLCVYKYILVGTYDNFWIITGSCLYYHLPRLVLQSIHSTLSNGESKTMVSFLK